MIIDEVRLKNFRSHHDTKLSLGQGTTVIIGENGAGKTSILEAISFALFKEKPDGVGVDELISLGKQEGEVSLLFHANGRRYRVRRRRDKRGAESYFYQVNGEMDALLVKGEREVTSEVEATLGMNGELFTSAVYIKQGEIDRLLSGDAATRKRHIGKLIGAEDMENTHKNFLKIINEYELRLRELSRIPEELEERKNALAEEKKAVKALRSELTDIEGEIKKEEGVVEELEKRIEALEGIAKKFEEAEKRSVELSHLKERLNRISDYETELKETEEGAKEAEGVEKEAGELKEKVHGYEVLKERAALAERELDDLRRRTAGLQRELERTFEAGSSLLGTPITSIGQLEKEMEEALKRLEKEIEVKGGELERLQRDLAEKRAALGAVKKALSELGDAVGSCPVCGRELTDRHKQGLTAKYSADAESLEKRITLLSGHLTRVKKEAEDLGDRKASISKINIEAAKERRKWLDEGNKRISEIEERLKKDRSALASLPPLVERLKGLEKRFAQLKQVRDRYIEALGFLRKNLSEKEPLVAKASELEEGISELKREAAKKAEALGSAPDNLASDLAEAKKDLKTASSALTVLKEKKAALVSSITEKKRRVSELSEEISRKKALSKERKSLLEFKELLEKIRSIFHKDRLQREIRLKAKPLIEEYTREVFLRFNLPYSDVTLTDDFSLRVHGPDGEESIDMLSGGERIAAALALRVGLSRALSGPVMELIILDEPTIHLDSQRRRELVDVIKRLATIPQTIVVTHDKEFEESADRIVEVEKVNGVSVVR